MSTARTAVMGDWPGPIRDPIDLLRLGLVVATVVALASGNLRGAGYLGIGALFAWAVRPVLLPRVLDLAFVLALWVQGAGEALGLYDTYPGLIIPYLTFALPLAIYTLVAFFREIPWELEQAAQIDGATPFQAFRRVILPLAAPGVFTAAILVFIFAWNDFVFAITLTSSDAARTVPAALAFFQGESQFTSPTGNIAAAAVLVTIPIIIFVLIFQRRIVAGLTSGAVKG